MLTYALVFICMLTAVNKVEAITPSGYGEFFSYAYAPKPQILEENQNILYTIEGGRGISYVSGVFTISEGDYYLINLALAFLLPTYSTYLHWQ